MDAGDLDLQVRPAAGEVFWRVRYRSPAGNPVDAELNVFVDVETGEVLPAMDVANERDPAVPTLARIAAAYPNPFATETTLQLELDRPAEVRLRVFDVLGREVETLVDGRRGVGIHRETWRPAADLPVGMYIVRLEAGTAVLTTSVLLAR
ncbi:MAG: T9SS type A sorting domain-containing protein [Rhodothermales bacterium]|nr:T9SS type A sorting domain-containing protein [Rhodothermales bacterium]